MAPRVTRSTRASTCRLLDHISRRKSIRKREERLRFVIRGEKFVLVLGFESEEEREDDGVRAEMCGS